MKIVIVVMLVGILVALGSAGLFMLRRGDKAAQRSSHMARALAVRVGLSVALFLFILLAWHLGWVRPQGLPIGS
jgi:hypothetical protein